MNSPIWVVFCKEALENLRDRRTILSALFFGPIFGPLIFAAATSLMLQRAMIGQDEPLHLSVTGREHAPNLVSFLHEHGADITEGPATLETATAAVRSGKLDLVLVIPKEYATKLLDGDPAPLDLVWDSSDSKVQKYAARTHDLIEGYGRRLAAQRLMLRGVSPTVVTPLALRTVDIATPAGRAILVLGVMTYMLLLATLMGGLYLAIDVTAGERERGSLEPLFTLPVTRAQLVFGKALATCLFMIISLALTLTIFVWSLRFVPLESIGMSANVGARVALQIFVSMLPIVPMGAGLMLCVGALARSYREAQTWLGFVLLIPTLPIVFASINSLRPSLPLMAIPSLSQHLLATGFLRGDAVSPVEMLVSAASTLALGCVLIYLAVMLYRRESIVG